jgi:hypothetical protein
MLCEMRPECMKGIKLAPGLWFKICPALKPLGESNTHPNPSLRCKRNRNITVSQRQVVKASFKERVLCYFPFGVARSERIFSSELVSLGVQLRRTGIYGIKKDL